jgi:hypothetical protein
MTASDAEAYANAAFAAYSDGNDSFALHQALQGLSRNSKNSE